MPRRRGLPDWAQAWLARRLMTLALGHIEVAGAGQVPERGGLLVVANHFNSLVDGVLLLGFLPRAPRFLAAAPLWDRLLIRPFLRVSGAIPVYRRHETGRAFSKNKGSLADVQAVLGSGGVVAMFPEGMSHDGTALLPMKSGAARIALGAAAGGVSILPVWLDYADKTRFRSGVRIVIGSPFPVSPHDNPRDLTRRIGAALAGAGAVQLRAQALGALARTLCPAADPSVEVKTDGDGALAAYRDALDAAGLRDRDVALPESGRPPAEPLRSLVVALLALPAAAGIAANGLTYAVVRAIGRAQERDKQATYSIVAGLVLFPATWVLWAFAGGICLGWAGAVAGALGAPLAGWLTVGLGDVWSDLRRDRAGRARLTADPEFAERLLSLRSAAKAALGG